MVADPISSVTVLATLLGIWFIVIGLFEVIGAFMIRRAVSGPAAPRHTDEGAPADNQARRIIRGSWSRVTEDLIASTGSLPRQRLLSDWRAAVFAPVGDGQRRRRGSDGVRLALAVLALVCCVLVIHYDSRIDRAVAQVLNPPPRSITWLVTVVYEAGSYGVAVVLVLLALVARRWVIARDIALAVAGTAVVSGSSSWCSAARAGDRAGW